MSKQYDAIIIGAGHNGLVCATYLAKAGHSVVVFEANEQVGGAAITREFSPGYSVSACAHLLHLLHPQIVSDLSLTKHGMKLAKTVLSRDFAELRHDLLERGVASHIFSVRMHCQFIP